MRILYLICALSCLLLLNSLNIKGGGADAIVGTWLIESGEAKVKIYKSGEKYHGKVVWLKEPTDKKGNPKTDSRNKEESLRSRTLLNMILLRDFAYNPDTNVWYKGKIYKPGLGQEVDGIISYVDVNTIKVKGSLGMLSETQVWKRTQ